MADHGVQFANSLHQMHTDVDELIARIERDRKHWKTEGLNSEKKVKDAESALEKAKARYDSLAEDYDRVKTGGSTSGRVFTVKGPKSAEKHEEDLNRKVQAADAEYQSKVQTARTTRQDNTSTWRPQAVKAIQELILESDSALTLQLQKFGEFFGGILSDGRRLIAQQLHSTRSYWSAMDWKSAPSNPKAIHQEH